MSLSSWLILTSGTAPSFALSLSPLIEGQSSLAITSNGTSSGLRSFLNKDAGTATTGYISTRFQLPSSISTDSQFGLIAISQSTILATPTAYYFVVSGSNLTQAVLTKTTPTGTTLATLPLGTTIATTTNYALAIAWDIKTASAVLKLVFGTPDVSQPYGIARLATTTYTDSSSPYVTTNLGCGLFYNKSSTTSPQSTISYDVTIIGDPTGSTNFNLLADESWEFTPVEPATLLLDESWETGLSEPNTALTFTVTGVTTDVYERWES